VGGRRSADRRWWPPPGVRTAGQISPISSFQAHPQAGSPRRSSSPPGGGSRRWYRLRRAGRLASAWQTALRRNSLSRSRLRRSGPSSPAQRDHREQRPERRSPPSDSRVAPLSAAQSRFREVIAAGNEIASPPVPLRRRPRHLHRQRVMTARGSLSFVFRRGRATEYDDDLRDSSRPGAKPGPGKWDHRVRYRWSHVHVHRRAAVLTPVALARDRLTLVQPLGRRVQPRLVRDQAPSGPITGRPGQAAGGWGKLRR